MEDDDVDNGDEREAEAITPAGNSLESRMAQARDRVEQQTTEKFPIPTWEDMVAVELRVLGWKRMRQLGKRNEKIRDESLQELYTVADQLLAATVGFHEILPNGDMKETDHTWISLARAGSQEPLPEDLTPRQALFALIKPDSLIPLFWQDWQNWVKSAKRDLDEEVEADFVTTG